MSINQELVVTYLRKPNATRRQVWSFVPKGQDGAEELARCAKAMDQSRLEGLARCKANGVTYEESRGFPEDWLQSSSLEIMPFGEYEKLEREYFLNDPVNLVTREQYWDALEALPPLHWTTHKGVEVFCMSEMTCGTYTSQYAKTAIEINGEPTIVYATKSVCAYSRDTWITQEQIKIAVLADPRFDYDAKEGA